MAAGGSNITVAEAKGVIHEVVTALQNKNAKQIHGGVVSQIAISEVLKGGSLGKGTTVPGDFDVDLVIFTRSLTPDEAAKIGGYGQIMMEYDQYLRSQLMRSYQKKGVNEHSLQFKYSNISIDLLISPYFDSKQQYYRFLEGVDREKIPLFSCSASRWQIEFVQSYPNIVLEYIKRTKAWRNNTWYDDEGGRPSSYLIELLVIKAYENGGNIDAPAIIKQQLVKLVCNKKVVVYWTQNYPANEIWKFNSRSPPYIIDPANPSNNLYISGVTKSHSYAANAYGGDWGKFRSEISSLDLSRTGY